MSERDEIREQKEQQLRDRLEGGDRSGGAAADRTEPVHVDGPEHLRSLVDEGGVVLTDFYADWCGPCKMLEPIVADIAAETDATVAKVDVDAQQSLAREYRVQGVPTMYLFADGQQVEQLVGVRQKDELASLIQQYA